MFVGGKETEVFGNMCRTHFLQEGLKKPIFPYADHKNHIMRNFVLRPWLLEADETEQSASRCRCCQDKG